MRHSRYWHYRALYLAQPALDALLPALGITRVPGFISRAAGTSPPKDLGREHVHVEGALALIRARFRERITVDALATAAGMSPFQLIRQFNRLTGMPPHAHVLRARLHEAIRQMRSGARPGDAAAASGFYDQSALTRHFRRAYGITPGQYLRARRTDA